MAPRDTDTDIEWRAYAQRLATSLRQVRQRAGLSQEQVAYRAGITRFTYQKYEKGESRPGMAANPTLRSLLSLSQVLGVSLDDLLPGDVPDLRIR